MNKLDDKLTEKTVEKEKYSAPAVSKMLDLIELLTKRSEGLSINEISRLINSPVNSVYRICLVLEKRGYLIKNFHTGLYRLGIGFHFIGQSALNNMDIRNNALPIMMNIHNEFNETVHLCIISNNKLILIDQTETTQPIRIHVDSGTMLHPHASAFGKIILAYLDGENLESYYNNGINGLEKLTKNTITGIDELTAQFREIRKTNIAYDLEEYMDGVVCVGSAVFDLSNHVVASIGLVGPRYRIKNSDMKVMGDYIKKQADTLSKSLGYNG